MPLSSRQSFSDPGPALAARLLLGVRRTEKQTEKKVESGEGRLKGYKYPLLEAKGPAPSQRPKEPSTSLVQNTTSERALG